MEFLLIVPQAFGGNSPNAQDIWAYANVNQNQNQMSQQNNIPHSESPHVDGHGVRTFEISLPVSSMRILRISSMSPATSWLRCQYRYQVSPIVGKYHVVQRQVPSLGATVHCRQCRATSFVSLWTGNWKASKHSMVTVLLVH